MCAALVRAVCRLATGARTDAIYDMYKIIQLATLPLSQVVTPSLATPPTATPLWSPVCRLILLYARER